MYPSAGYTALMVGTHLVALPGLGLTVWFADSKMFVTLALQITASIIWHLSHPGLLDETIISRASAQSLDYFMIGVAINFIILALVSVRDSFSQTIFITNVFLLAFMRDLLTTTPVFSFYLIAHSAFIFLFRAFVLQHSMPLRRIDYAQLAAGLLIGGIGLIFYNMAEDCDDPAYLSSHPIWHVVIYLMVNIGLMIYYEVSIMRWFNLRPNFRVYEKIILREMGRVNPALPVNFRSSPKE